MAKKRKTTWTNSGLADSNPPPIFSYMMFLSALRPDASLVEYLEYRARSISVRGLVGRAIVAIVFVAGSFGKFPVAHSVIGTLAGAYFCYSAWGLLDRARSHSVDRGWMLAAKYLRLLCGLFVGLGVLSGIGLLLAVWFVALGSAWVL